MTVTVTDTANSTATAVLSLAVPTALPPQCSGQPCALLTPDGHTVQIPATAVNSVSYDTTGAPTQVILTGTAPTVGQILVLAPNPQAPSGLIVAVNTVTTNGDGTTTVTVTQARPTDAYAEGTINALDTTPPGAYAGSSGDYPAHCDRISGLLSDRAGILHPVRLRLPTYSVSNPRPGCRSGVGPDRLGDSVK